MDKIKETFQAYRHNVELKNKLNHDLFSYRCREEWKDFYHELTKQQIAIYQSNVVLFHTLTEILQEPLTEERAECLFQENYQMYRDAIDDYEWILKVCFRLLPFYEERYDLDKLTTLYGMCYYEINEVKNRQLMRMEFDFTYLDKLLALIGEYAHIENRRVRLRFWIAYYNKVILSLEREAISLQEAMEIAEEVKEKWVQEDVQRLDGNDAEFIAIIKRLKDELSKGILTIDTANSETRRSFLEKVHGVYEEAMLVAKSEFELEPTLYASYLFSLYDSKKRSIHEIFDSYMDYYQYRCLQHQEDEATTEELLDFYRYSIEILTKWASLGVNSEKIRKMVGSFMALAERRWKNLSVDLMGKLNLLMKRLCYEIIQYGNTEVDPVNCVLQMVMYRDFHLFLHSNMVNKVSIMLGELIYEERPGLLQKYQTMEKRDLIRRISENALLHDVGKSDMYDIIYRNNRPANEEEINLLKQHSEIGAAYIETLKGLAEYHEVILFHHVDYDGKGGFPSGLDISTIRNKIMVDIVHLADSIENMLELFIRQGIPVDLDMIRRDLENGKGTKYNPDLVSLVLQNGKILDNIKSVLMESHYDEMFQYMKSLENVSIHQDLDQYLESVKTKFNEIARTKDYEAFVPFMDKLFEIAARENTDRSIGLAYFFTLRYHYLKKDYLNSINCGLETVRYLENTEEYRYLCNAYNILGILMQFQGNAEYGIGYFLKSAECAKMCEGATNMVGIAYINIANLFKEFRNYDRAIYYYTKAIDKVEVDKTAVGLYLDLTFCYVKMDDRKAVMEWLPKIEKLRETNEFEDFQMHVFMAVFAEYIGDLEKMEMELKKTNDDLGFLKNYLLYVSEINVYLDMLDKLGRYDELVVQLEKYIVYCELNHVSHHVLISLVQRRIKVAYIQGDQKNATYYGKYIYRDLANIKKQRAESTLQIEKSTLSNLRIQRKQREALKTNQILEREVMEAQQANAAKATFLSSMSHEIRTPIHAVLGLDEMILRECHEEQILQYAQDIQNAGKTLLGVINDVLDISKMESGKMDIIPERYQLVDLIQELKNMIESRAKDKGLGFEIQCEPDVPKAMYGDDLRIKQVVLNILTNAVKYTKEGSVTLHIKSQRMDAQKVQLILSVKDTGIGMKKEDMSKLLKPFERIEEQKNRGIEGTGLGMSIVSNLVKQMDGTLEVESEYGKGSEFTVSFPQIVVSWIGVGDLGEQKKNSSKGRKEALFTAPEAEILVVDDNAVNLKVVSSLLKRTKVKVTTADSGKECLELLKQKRFHMILLDHRMPELDGVETLQILRKMDNENSQIPVIALTANAVSGAADYYLEKGFDELVTKPVDHVEMERKIKNLLPQILVHANDGSMS